MVRVVIEGPMPDGGGGRVRETIDVPRGVGISVCSSEWGDALVIVDAKRHEVAAFNDWLYAFVEE